MFLSLAVWASFMTITAAPTTTQRWLDPNMERSSRFMTLEGTWKFCFVKDHDKAPQGFQMPKFDDSKWVDFPVPGLFEINGYGEKVYKNVGYSWNNQFQSNPPYVEERNNYTGSYRREFLIPSEWKGERIFMHVGSATSNLTLWVCAGATAPTSRTRTSGALLALPARSISMPVLRPAWPTYSSFPTW